MHAFIVILLYLAAAAAAVHAVRRESASPALTLPATYLAFAAIAAHGAWLLSVLRPLGGDSLSIADSASFMGLVIGLGGALSLFAPRFRGIAAVVLGIAGLLAAGTGSLPERQAVTGAGWPFAVHVVLAMGSAGMFAIAAVFVVLLMLQDTQLRHAQPARWLAALPPVESLEHALFTVLATGMASLTVAILAGLLFVTNLFQQHLAHKFILALTAWLVFAVLLIGHWRYGWRGRKARHYTLAGFVLLAVAYFGSKFVLEFVLGRHWG